MPSDKKQGLYGIQPFELYTIHFVDGMGNEETRIVGRVKGTKEFRFALPNGTEKNMRRVAGWLQKELEEKLDPPNPKDIPDAPLQINTGSPLEDM